jgi:transcriptional regulator with XRE-family HTH domain
MAKKPAGDLQRDLSRRLRAVQAELRLSDPQMAAMLGVGRTRWNNWVTNANMPEEEAMIALCDIADINMDWLYRGQARKLPVALAIRLEARMQGMDPDQATPKQMQLFASRLALVLA